MGNVGTALSTLADRGLPDALTIVCEASSFQLEDTERFAPDAAVLLNLAEDHLDRHGTFDAYRTAKLEVFARQPLGTVAVAPEELAAEELPGEARAGAGSAPARAPGSPTRDGRLWWDEERLMAVDEIRLRGPHNRLNAMAAAAVTLARGMAPAAVREGLASFAGVAHRLEEIATVGGVLYVNDSKATNVASAVAGLESFAGGVHVILGGRGKGGVYAPLAVAVAERARAAYLIGETAAELAAALADTGVPLHADRRPRARAGGRARGGAAGRGGAAVAGVRLVRPVRRL